MISLQRLLIRLYPKEFREQFQDEMLHVLAATAADARQKGFVERGLFALHEIVGLLIGILRERRSALPAKRESPISSLRAPIAILVLYTLCTRTMRDLGIHALFAPFSYVVVLGGILLGLWMVSSQRILGSQRKRTGLVALALFFWMVLPVTLRISENQYQARLREHPVEFFHRYPGIAVQATIATAEPYAAQPGLTASETIPLVDNRRLTLIMRSEIDAPPYRILVPMFVMGLSFLWRRRLSDRAIAQ